MTFDEWYTEKVSESNMDYAFSESWETSYEARRQRLRDIAQEAWEARYNTLTYHDI